MKILLASSEVHPFSKTGGLADMVAALAKTLGALGHTVSLVTPLYRGVRQKVRGWPAEDPVPIEIPMGFKVARGSVWKVPSSPGVTLYFVEQPAYFDRAALYVEKGADYPDNAERFIFFSKAVARLARDLPEPPEIVHIHDWQVGLVPLLIQHRRAAESWIAAPRTVCTIHNLAYQGVFPSPAYEWTNLPWDYFGPDGVEFYGQLNCLKGGLVYSDELTTVSPRYAREITTEEFGCGLDGVLRGRQDHLHGILNGVDYSEWNTETNPHLKIPFSAEDLAGKAAAKAALQAEMQLPVQPDVPLFGSVTRLAEQKGLDIQLAALEEMLSARMQFVLLGSGTPEFEEGFRSLKTRHPDKVGVRVDFDAGLAHRIEAGCDFFIMPSRFEPCGLNQMYSLRYGAIPIVRATGGLDDSVTDIAESWEEADGIKFREYSPRALTKAIRKALVLYGHPDLLDLFRQNGMTKDFSWEITAHEYEKVYERALAARVEPKPPADLHQ